MCGGGIQLPCYCLDKDSACLPPPPLSPPPLLSRYVQVQQVYDNLLGHQPLLPGALSLPQDRLGDGPVLEATQLGARAPQLAELHSLTHTHTHGIHTHTKWTHVHTQETSLKFRASTTTPSSIPNTLSRSYCARRTRVHAGGEGEGRLPGGCRLRGLSPARRRRALGPAAGRRTGEAGSCVSGLRSPPTTAVEKQPVAT